MTEIAAVDNDDADDPLFGFDQVLLSPHIGGLTQDAAERMAISSAQNILDFFAGTIDRSLIVNREHVYANHHMR